MWRVPVALGLSFALCVAAAVAMLGTRFAAQNLCDFAQAEISESTDADVAVATCRVEPSAGAIALTEVSIQPRGRRPLAHVARLRVVVHVDLLQARLRLDRLEIDEPALVLAIPPATPGAAQPSPSGQCLPDLSRFELGDVIIRRGSFDLTTSDGVAIKVKRLSAKLVGSGSVVEARVRLKGGRFDLRDPKGGVDVVNARVKSAEAVALFDLSTGALEVNSLELETPEGNVNGSARVTDICHPRIDARVHVEGNLDAVAADYLPILAEAKGRAVVDAHATVLLPAGSRKELVLAVDGQLATHNATVVGIDVGEARSHFDFDLTRLHFDKLEIPLGRGRLAALGEVVFDPTKLTVDARLLDVTFSEVMRRLRITALPFGFTASGRVRLTGPLVPDVRLAVQPELDATLLAVTDGPYDAPTGRPARVALRHVQLVGVAEVTPQKTTIREARLAVGRESQVEVDGVVDYTKDAKLQLKVRLPRVAAADVGPLAGSAWAGRGSLAGTIAGPAAYPDVQLDATLQDLTYAGWALGQVATHVAYRDLRAVASGLRATSGRTTYDTEATIDLHGNTPLVKAHAEIEDGRVLDLLRMASANLPAARKSEGLIDARVKGSAEVEGPIDALSGTVKLTLREVNFASQRFDWGELSTNIHAGKVIALTSLELHRAHAQASLSGELNTATGAVRGTLAVKGMALDQLDAPRNTGAQLAGTISVRATADGTLENSVVRAHVDLGDVAVRAVPLGSGGFDATLDGNAFALKGNIGAQQLDAHASLAGDTPWSASLALNVDDFTAFFPPGVDLGVGGGLAGSVQVTGTRAPDALRGNMTLRQLTVSRPGGFTATNRGPVTLELMGNKLFARQVQLTAPHTSASVTGWIDFAGQVDLALQAGLDLGILLGISPDVEHAAGHVELHTTMTGAAKSPNILGEATVHGAEMRLRGLQILAREIDGRLSFSQDIVSIDRLSAQLNSGTLRADGEVRLSRFHPMYVRLGAHVEDVPMRIGDGVSLAVGGDLALSGDPSALPLMLTGEMDLSRLHYTEEIELERALVDLVRRPVQTRVLEKAGEVIRLDVGMHLGKDVRVDNNVARAGLRGDLRLTGTNRRLGMLGGVQVEKGGIAYIRGKEFSITDAQLSFGPDRQSIEMAFDVNAQTQVRDYKVTMRSFGTAADPRVIFTSDPPLAEADIITLILTGVTTRELTNTATSGTGLALSALAEATGLSEQVRRFVPKNSVLRDPSFTFTSDFSEATGRIEAMGEFQATLFTDALRLRFLGAPQARTGRALLEYRKDDHVSLLMRYDNEHANASSLGDWGLDLRYRWESE